MKRTAIAAAGALAAVGVAVGAVAWRSSHREGPAGCASVPVAQACKPGPDVTCYPDVELLDSRGEIWTPDVLAGKAVIVNYWATWCAPCVEEIPLLAAAQRDHGGRVVVLGLLTDPVDDAKLEAFADEHGLDYPVVRVDVETAEAFGHPQVLPTTLVFDPGGTLRETYAGPLTAEKLEDWLAELLAPARP